MVSQTEVNSNGDGPDTKCCVSGTVDAIIRVMKILAVALLLALMTVSPVHAFLRPRFPHRTAPPSNHSGMEMAEFAHPAVSPN